MGVTESSRESVLNSYGVRSDLIHYVEEEIMPRYVKADEGHRQNHINYVIDRSLSFASKYNEKHSDKLDMNAVYAVAAYHDLGLTLGDRSVHEILSAELMWGDVNLGRYFTRKQVMEMSQAVEDHRSSLKREPRSMYGKVVSQADRDTDAEHFVKRTWLYLKDMPEYRNDFELMKSNISNHIIEKYGENGTALNKIWFEDEQFSKFLTEVREYARDDDKLTKEIIRLMKDDAASKESERAVDLCVDSPDENKTIGTQVGE